MKMRSSWLRTLGLAAILSLVPLAQADQVQMMLTGLGNGTTAGTTQGAVYVGPYESNFGLVVCADFFIHSELNKPWDANVSLSGGDISDTRQAALLGTDSAQSRYNQAAYLVEQLLAAYTQNNRALQRQLSFAVWDIFTPGVINLMTNSTDKTKATEFRNLAASFSNVVNSSLVIYTPVAVAGGMSFAPPQEFLAIRTPEGSVTILWGINLLAAIGMILLFRRRTARGSV